MMPFGKILSSGYFPKELPPIFSTKDFAERLALNIANYPAKRNRPFSTMDSAYHQLCLPPGGLRQLNVPNPTAAIFIADQVGRRIDYFISFTEKSSISQSIPEFWLSPHSRAITTWSDYPDIFLTEPRTRVRSNAPYLAKADIKDFYRSITWTETGKLLDSLHLDLSSADKNDFLGAVFGNRTSGFPVGPDWSFLLAECLLTEIDMKVMENYPENPAFRFFDDLEIAAHTRAEAEEIISFLAEIVRAHKLDLNWKKSLVMELPQAVRPAWADRLDSMREALGPSWEYKKEEYSRYLETALLYAHKYPQGRAIYWTIRNGLGSNDEVGSLTLDYLITALDIEPYSTQWIIRALLGLFYGYPIEGHKNDLEEAINKSIATAISTQNMNAAVWGLYFCLAARLPMHQKVENLISNFNDPFIQVLTVDAIRQGLLTANLSDYLLERTHLFRTEELYTSNWLLAYEAVAQGWLPRSKSNYLDENFSFFMSLCVSFYYSPNVPWF
jgi:hypothetical protein